MKKTCFLFVVVLSGLLVSAQQKLVYNMEPDLQELSSRMVVDSTSGDAAFRLQMKQLLMSKIKTEQITYTIHDTIILEQRRSVPAISYVHSSNNLKYQIQETKADGKISVSTMDLDFKKLPGWNVRYEVKKYKEAVKTIKGYPCYKVDVTEFKTIDNDTDVRKFEMWVTDKIALPAFIVAGLHDRIVPECPLEIRMWDGVNAKPSATITVMSIE